MVDCLFKYYPVSVMAGPVAGGELCTICVNLSSSDSSPGPDNDLIGPNKFIC